MYLITGDDIMQTDYKKFLNLLDKELKDESLLFIHDLLKSNKIALTTLYNDFFKPALNEFVCGSEDEDYCIWKEHTRTSIVRTILESTYPFLIEAKKGIKKNHKKVLVVCPTEEFHEVGALIVTNYFLLHGYDAQYIGANTPKHDIIAAVKALEPSFLAISVTNYYNLVVTKQITEAIKAAFPNVKVILGGQAFNKPGALNNIIYDYHVNSFETFVKLDGELK